jgi:hypothetical protein
MSLLRQIKSKKKAHRGIALVAVLIIVGILVIIGLSLFALGGYEAGHYERRWELEQAFCKAESGVERARWVLVETHSKSKALIDSAGIVVYEVDEIDENGQAVRVGEDLIDFYHEVRIRSKGIVKGQEREIVAIFAPGMRYAIATSQHITFHGGSNDWSAADAIDHVNDVYIQGGLLYDHHINHPDWPYKYDWARQDTIVIPDYLKIQPAFSNFFQPFATDTLQGQQFWGDPGGGNPWSELPNNSIVYVKGAVDISENVRQDWATASVDVTIIATGTITVTNGRNDDDDRLLLIGLQNIIFEGDGADKSINAFVATGGEVWTTGLSGGGLGGGEGAVNGMVFVCKNIDMRGYDPDEIYPLRRGWTITERIETILLNGGLPVLTADVAGLQSLSRISWGEVDPA